MRVNTMVVTRSGIRTVRNQNRDSYKNSTGALSHAIRRIALRVCCHGSIGLSIKTTTHSSSDQDRSASKLCARQLKNLRMCANLQIVTTDRQTVAAAGSVAT